jgi:hypothetical protein
MICIGITFGIILPLSDLLDFGVTASSYVVCRITRHPVKLTAVGTGSKHMWVRWGYYGH